mgnify:CR=1 FL=1
MLELMSQRATAVSFNSFGEIPETASASVSEAWVGPSPLIKAGETYNFPAEGLGLEMYPLAGHKKDAEAFILIATKESFDALKLIKKGEEIQPKDFYNAILSIPANSRAEEIIAYEVREK